MNRIAALGAKRLRSYFQDEESILEKYSMILAKAPDDENIYEKAPLYNDIDVVDLRCSMLLDYTERNEIGRVAFELAVLRYVEPITGELLELIATGNQEGVTLETAARVCGFGSVSTCMPLIADAYEGLRILLSSRNETSDIARAVLKAEYPLIAFMADMPILEIDTLKFCREFTPGKEVPSVYGMEQEVLAIAEQLDNTLFSMKESGKCEPVTVVISGAKESGKARAMERIAYELQLPLLFADSSFLLQVDNLGQILRKLYLHCFLSDSILCIENLPKGKATDRLIQEIRRGYHYFSSRPLVLLCEEGIKPLSYLDGRVLSLNLQKNSHTTAFLLWQGFLEEYGFADKLDPGKLASKMKLKPGQIKRICELIEGYLDSTREFPTLKQIYQFCYDVLDDGRYENIKQVDSNFTLEDLKVSPKTMQTLKDICAQVEYGDKIYHDWGMAKKYEYGRCVSAIFAGVPGTGKTMAVHALANALDLKLYKVDLSQMVDKYIGETEKRLEEVFAKAEKSHMILFFDEADAIMGKRSETKDSKDKYANTEIAYILQRIEEFDGIVILSTNYLQNIDSAFMRRIKFIVHFELPDAETRKEIWQSSFAKSVPLAEDIEWDMLAEKYQLSGGNIKNIVLNATFLAAADDGKVNMEHIMKALIRENAKDNKVSFAEDYGNYSYLARE